MAKNHVKKWLALFACMLALTMLLAGCGKSSDTSAADDAAKTAADTEEADAPEAEPAEEDDEAAEEENETAEPEAAEEAAEKTAPEPDAPDSEALAEQFLAALENCDPVGDGENMMGFAVTGIEKDGEDYIVSWTFSNDIIAGSAQNMAYAFSLMTFYDPEDLSHSYQGFTMDNGSLQVDFEEGESISYDHVRIRSDAFATDSGVVYLYFEGAPDEAETIRTVPMFYTLILGDEPKLAEDTPRRGAMLLAADGAGVMLEVNGVPRQVEIGEIGRDSSNRLSVTLVSEVFTGAISMSWEDMLPVVPRVVVGGETFDPMPSGAARGQFTFVFDTEGEPDSIFVGTIQDYFDNNFDAFAELAPVATAQAEAGGSSFSFEDPKPISR